MANPLQGYNALGHALAGGNAPNAALLEAQGEYLGANTSNAIAQANQRIMENEARKNFAKSISGLYPGHPEVAEALGAGARANVPLEQITGSRLQDQQFENRAAVANTALPDATRAGAAQAIDPNSPGLIRPTAQGEAFTNALHPEQGLTVTPLGEALVPAKAGEMRSHAELLHEEATHPEKFHFPPVGGAPLDPAHEAMLKDLYDNGWLDPSRVTRYNATPSMIESAHAAMTGGTYNPGGTAHGTLQKQDADFSGEGKNGQRIRAGNALSSHIKMLGALADAQDANDLPTAQKISMALTGQAGSDFPTMNKLASHFVGSEMDSFLASGNSTLEGRQEAQNHFNQNEVGASQLRANVALGRQLMGGQFAALKQTYASAPGRNAQDVSGFANRFLPANRDILDDYEKKNGEIKPAGRRPAVPAAVTAPTAPAGGSGTDPLGILGSQ